MMEQTVNHDERKRLAELHLAVQRLIEAGRRLYQAGLVAASDGNLSCRLSDGSFLITASGRAKGFLPEADILHLSAEGKALSHVESALPSRPSTEIAMHRAIYDVRPDITSIIHAHPPFATAFALVDADLNENAPDEVQLQLGKVLTAPYAPAGSTQLAAGAAAELTDGGYVLLLARHGAVCLGGTIEQALFRMEALEHAAKISAFSRMLRR